MGELIAVSKKDKVIGLLIALSFIFEKGNFDVTRDFNQKFCNY
ncbi:hypothetical protein KF201_1702 [Lactococcus lactis subsp. lactis]|nr:hypothetical protein KF201_1702 [Lactococcus lactis subsp. lactis]